MIVVGGYNSSNTCNLARICAERVPTFHIADPDCLVSADEIRHRPVGPPSTHVSQERVSRGWLPASDPVTVGLTAGRLDAEQHRRRSHRTPGPLRILLAATLLSQNPPPGNP